MNRSLRCKLSVASWVIGPVASLIACLIWTNAAAAQAVAVASCRKLSDVQIVQLLNRWRAEFLSGSPEGLSALYADDATLVATKDGKPYKGKEAIRTYYKDLLAKHPMVSIRPSSLSADCGTATVSGMVVYRLAGERKGTRVLLGGRYTTEFSLVNGEWRIVHHSLAADPRSFGNPVGKGAAITTLAPE